MPLHASAMPRPLHAPVLIEPLAEMIGQKLRPRSLVLDATFGAGGYTKRLLELGHRVVALDQDPTAAAIAANLKHDDFRFIRGRFGSMLSLASDSGYGAGSFDACVLDIGTSSMQLDNGQRGFSFKNNGPLDMRMDPENNTVSAATILCWFSEAQLAELFLRYGEDTDAHIVARAIVQQRTRRPLTSTAQLAKLVTDCKPARDRFARSHPATKIFQALRIAVNNEVPQSI